MAHAEPQHFIAALHGTGAAPPRGRGHGVDLRLGWELTGFARDDCGVTRDGAQAASGMTTTLRASYTVGADGSSSLVQRAIGAA